MLPKIYTKTKRPQNSAPGVSVTQSAISSTASSNHIAWKDGGIGSEQTIFMFEKDGVTFEFTKKNYKTILSEVFTNNPKILNIINESKFKNLGDIISKY
ncbi:hypothetical protein [Pedobacter sp. ASV28]|uniref:hypothetical protein n=1 Tax=Pedobacter sp. ASV28 TaxID=2795123 RepID=UPI0018ED69AA|nr:hypothetical protein [Pedobacter sp. ASV28]